MSFLESRWSIAILTLGVAGCDSPTASTLDEPLAAISAGGQTSCALTVSGAALCWGRGTDGQLGNGSSTSSSVPVPVGSDARFSSVDVGFYHACALTPAGEAYCWGATGRTQNAGQLGTGTADRGNDRPSPVATEARFVSISAGQAHTCALSVDGTGYCWGDNHWGQLGDGTTASRTRPVQVAGSHRFVDLSAGDAHTCGVTTAGTVLCWGDNFSSAVTAGEHTPAVCADGYDRRCTPDPFAVAVPVPVRTVRAGGATCATTVDGASYCWGGDLHTPIPVTLTSTRSTRVALGTGHGCGVDPAGTAECWGAHRVGQLGSGSEPADFSATPVLVADAVKFRQVDAGMFHTCAVSDGGNAWCWGSNREGQLGTGDDSGPALCGYTHPCSTTPVQVRRRGR